jgi:3-oxoacyl-[acyl-carrier protein] reductase
VKPLLGRSIIVTGGSRGIGRAIVESCVALGAVVGVNFVRSQGPAQELLELYPENIELLCFDVGDHEAANRVMQSFIQRHSKLDALVNNAGVFAPHLLISGRDLSKAAEELRVNTLGTMNCTHIALPFMLKNRGGLIINMSSTAVPHPVPGQAAYSASKAAVEAFTRAIGIEYANRGVRCVCLRPGPVDTDMLRGAVGKFGMLADPLDQAPPRRISSPTEIADTVRMLLSGAKELATGSTLDLTTGYVHS